MNTHHHWIIDSGHAWFVVSLEELEELGITDEISKFSYYNAGMVYLEEDCDFEVYRNAVIKAKGRDDAVVGIFNDHCIDGDWKGRNYSRMGDAAVRLLIGTMRAAAA